MSRGEGDALKNIAGRLEKREKGVYDIRVEYKGRSAPGSYPTLPDATRLRMYHEALQEFLPGTKVYIDTSKDGGTEKLLPIESFYDKEAEK